MEFKRDIEADAIYISLSNKPYAYGKDLDNERRIDYAADNTPIGVELLCVSKGVNLNDLPHVDEIGEALEANGIKIYGMKQHSHTELGYSSAVFEVRLASPATMASEGCTAGLKEEVTV